MSSPQCLPCTLGSTAVPAGFAASSWWHWPFLQPLLHQADTASVLFLMTVTKVSHWAGHWCPEPSKGKTERPCLKTRGESLSSLFSYTFFLKEFYLLIWERDREREIDLLFNLFIYLARASFFLYFRMWVPRWGARASMPLTGFRFITSSKVPFQLLLHSG